MSEWEAHKAVNIIKRPREKMVRLFKNGNGNNRDAEEVEFGDIIITNLITCEFIFLIKVIFSTGHMRNLPIGGPVPDMK